MSLNDIMHSDSGNALWKNFYVKSINSTTITGTDASFNDLTLTATSNQITIDNSNNTVINVPNPAQNTTITLNDTGVAASSFVTSPNTFTTIPINSGITTNNSGTICTKYPTNYNLILSGSRFVDVYLGSTAAGDVDVYTVPTGKNFSITSMNVSNGSVGSVIVVVYIKTGGNKYTITNTTITASSFNTVINAALYIAKAGDIVGVTINQTVSNIILGGIIFDNTSCMKQANIKGIAVGDNLLYECPTGKLAIPVIASPPFNAFNTAFRACQNSGNTISLTYRVVRNGVGYEFSKGSVTSGAAVTLATPLALALSPGDQIIVNCTALAAPLGSVWFTFAEYDISSL